MSRTNYFRPARPIGLAIARRFAGLMLGRAAALSSRWARHEGGIAVVEFALILPVLMMLFYGCIETTRYILVTQKAEKLAHTVADVTAQSATVSIANLDRLMEATNNIMEPFDFQQRGLVVISSLYRPQGEANARVNWRYSGGGTLVAESAFGAVGTIPVMPAGFGFDERENVIAAEVFMRWAPLLSDQFFEPLTIYRQAFYKPRFGALTTPPT
jgi:hypothetical protein